MLKYVKWCIWTFVLLGAVSVALRAQDSAQNFVYTNNDIYDFSNPPTTENSVSAFRVQTDGSLVPIGTYTTGGWGSGVHSYSANRIIVAKGSSNDFLYASNAGAHGSGNFATVSVFMIHSDGTLEQVGSAVSIGTFVSSPGDAGVSLAATPDGTYLYAGTTDSGTITTFSIDPETGLLSNPDTTFADGQISSMKVTPNGKFLVVPLTCPFCTVRYGLDVFSINPSDGSLQPAPGSPHLFSSIPVTSVAINKDANCASTLLYAGTSGSTIYVSNFDSTTGGLSPPVALSTIESVSGSGPSSNQVVVLSPDGNTLFSSNQGGNTVTAFAVGSDGSLSIPGTSASIFGSAPTTTSNSPGGLAVSQDGAMLYAADAATDGTSVAVSTFDLITSPPITTFDSSPTPTGQPFGLRSLAAYPANFCTTVTTRGLPTLNSIDPEIAFVGGSGFTMTLTGTNFGEDSVARFNGVNLTTDYTSPTRLTAVIQSSDLANVGQFLITVHNSLPTVGDSNSKPFNVIYNFLGLLPPYAGGGRHYRVNSTIPLRWQYAKADGTPVPSPDARPIVEVYPAEGCGEAHSGDLLPIETPGNSGKRYHAPSMTWQFNWKTSGMEAGCYVIYIKSLQTGQAKGPFPIRLVK